MQCETGRVSMWIKPLVCVLDGLRWRERENYATIFLMCASYMIKQRAVPRLVTDLRLDDFEQFFDKLIVPHRPAPVIVADSQQVVMRPMRFSLIPRWSKDLKPKFATHNARVESIAEKPTWREAFQKRHCIVPLTHFIEPIYAGTDAGFMVAFHDRKGEWLNAAGIWEEWSDKESGEVVESFAIITGEPPPFIAQAGHDRCPIFLEDAAAKDWLRLTDRPQAMLSFLDEYRSDLAFFADRHRPMRPGWEKRRGL